MQNLEQTQNSMKRIITNFRNLFALALITLTGTLTFVACGDDNEEIKKEDATELASAYSFADLNVKRTMALSQLIPIFQNDGLELWQEEDYYEATKYVSYQGTLLKYKVAFSCQDGTNLTNHAIEFWVEDIEKYADAEYIKVQIRRRRLVCHRNCNKHHCLCSCGNKNVYKQIRCY